MTSIKFSLSRQTGEGKLFRAGFPFGVFLASVAFLGLTGCVTRQDIRGLQADLYNIQQELDANLTNVKSQTDTVQTNQADLQNNIQELSQNLAALKVELEDNRSRMKDLTLRLDDLDAALSARMDAQIELLSGSKFVEKPLPSTMFNLANADYSRGRFAEAQKGFQQYLKLYPKSDQAVDAKIKLADTLAKLQDPDGALKLLDDVITNNSKHSLVATALLKKGEIEESLGKTGVAVKSYEILVKNYPFKPEAKAAEDRLNEIKNSSKK